jgi:hypothetical protein
VLVAIILNLEIEHFFFGKFADEFHSQVAQL